MKRIIVYVATVFATLLVLGDTPRAFLKVEYDEIRYLPNRNDSLVGLKHKGILLVANNASQYYDPHTFFVDSLEHDPAGLAALELINQEAWDEYHRSGKEPYYYMKERGFIQDSRYRSKKDFTTGIIAVKNFNGSFYNYPVEMSDLVWELGDSTKRIMGYECQIAEADYHGRHWVAWFAPEIPVQDGPWQLCGLPGLILEAKADNNKYEFLITGIQETNEGFKPDYDEDRYFNTKRKSFWKMTDYARRNLSSQIAAMTEGKVKLSSDVDYNGDYEYDFIETDYHE